MKKILFAIALLLTLGVRAQDEVAFEFSDGIAAGTLKSNMERNTSRLLTAINRAESSGKDINYTGIDIDKLASSTIGMMWNNVHFRVVDDDIVEHCLCIKTHTGKVIGYEARNIAIEMKPFDDSYEGDINQEVCINYDRTGKITDFNITIGLQQYVKLMKEGEELGDFDRRAQILYWVTQFKNAYCNKDINFMEDVFSDYALIITGKVIRRGGHAASVVEPSEVRRKDTVEYTTYTKEQYLNNLRRVFRNNSYINVKFDDIKIVRHSAKPNYYGVTLKQGWFSQHYHDEGIVFIVWDFTDEEHPVIMVRTWQPMQVGEGDIFTLKSFKLN